MDFARRLYWRFRNRNLEVTFTSHDIVELGRPRTPNEWEGEALRRLTSETYGDTRFDVVATQAATSTVVRECARCPTVWLAVETTVGPVVVDEERHYGVARAELRGVAADGVPTWVLLHIAAGYLYELEVSRADGEPLRSPPAHEALVTTKVDQRPDLEFGAGRKTSQI